MRVLEFLKCLIILYEEVNYMMNVAKTPPMGWNSWDCYGAGVTEADLLGNSEYMAKHLKKFGWEYVVCDIQWYEPTADCFEYNKFADLCMDEYSRLVPAENRFPSAKDGVGFTKIAEKIHDMGLKFGIHIMRGIPRQAIHKNTKIKGTEVNARDIAHPFSLCPWNTDMYGVDPNQRGAQEYYDSLFELYASWGVDYVKVDDICVNWLIPSKPYSTKLEVELIRRAIDRCGRPIVLSLSPGPAQIEEADHLFAHANMWRISEDFWDNWDQLYDMFERCRIWSPYVQEHHWPDCDMLPLGHIGKCRNKNEQTDRITKFTKDEQKTLLTLWSIFRSPLMMGGELRDIDDSTLSLLTNSDILRMHRQGNKPRQVYRKNDHIVWTSEGLEESKYVALFNASDQAEEVTLSLKAIGFSENKEYIFKNLWTGEMGKVTEGRITDLLPVHGSSCYEIQSKLT